MFLCILYTYKSHIFMTWIYINMIYMNIYMNLGNLYFVKIFEMTRFEHTQGFPGLSDGKQSACKSGNQNPWRFPGGSSGKEPSCQWKRHEAQIQSREREISWRRKWQATPVFLPRESHGQRSLAVHRVTKSRHDWSNLAGRMKAHI